MPNKRLEDPTEKYGIRWKAASTAAREAFSNHYLDIVPTPADESTLFTFTDTGWKLVLLMWIARFGVATEEYLAERFELQKDREVVKLFIEWGIEQGLLRAGGTMRTEPELVIATRKGLKAVGLASSGSARWQT